MKKFTHTAWCIVYTLLFMAWGCVKQNEKHSVNIQYEKTELGGCNTKSTSINYDTEIKDDVIVISASKNAIRVHVGLNYTCKTVPFEAQCEITDGIIWMYIIDSCNDISGCYERCMCYYTFDFFFKWEDTIYQPYKILLIDPRKESNVIISEGVISENQLTTF